MRSPGGSTFPYPYLGGELHCLKCGQLGADLDRLTAILDAEEAFLLADGRALRVWVDMYGTRWSTAACRLLVSHLDHLRPQLIRVALVGPGITTRLGLARAARRAGIPLPRPTVAFRDPEKAKTWLVRGRT